MRNSSISTADTVSFEISNQPDCLINGSIIEQLNRQDAKIAKSFITFEEEYPGSPIQ